MPNVTKKKNHSLAQTVQVSRRVPPPPPVGGSGLNRVPPTDFQSEMMDDDKKLRLTEVHCLWPSPCIQVSVNVVLTSIKMSEKSKFLGVMAKNYVQILHHDLSTGIRPPRTSNRNTVCSVLQKEDNIGHRI